MKILSGLHVVTSMASRRFITYLLISFSLIGATRSVANEIDKIRTNGEVNSFLEKFVSREFKNSPPLKVNSMTFESDGYSQNKFFKVDFDNNGLTDLVVNGLDNLLVVLDTGKKGYQLFYLDRGAFFLNKAKLIAIDTSAIPRKIIIHQSNQPEKRIDTLIFKFNRFIEYNPGPAVDFDFEEIKFKTDRCFGRCPVFEMTVKEDRSATYHAIEYNEETGEYHGQITKKEFEELMAMLKYLKIDELNYKYEVSWTDDQTATTEITYGKKKKIIVDYGKIGTFGLSGLYSKFFTWRKSMVWTE
jgi:hypothetical protein